MAVIRVSCALGSSIATRTLLRGWILRLTACFSCRFPCTNIKIPPQYSYPNVTKIPPQYKYQNSIKNAQLFFPLLHRLLPTVHFPSPYLLHFPELYLTYSQFILLLISFFFFSLQSVKRKSEMTSLAKVTLARSYLIKYCYPCVGLTFTSSGHLKCYTTGSLKLLCKCASKLISGP